MKAQTVTIVGMGRIGIAIARALRASAAGLTIVGHDRYRELVQKAKDEWGAIDKAEWNLVAAASVADILVLAVPLAELETTLSVIGGEVQPHTLVLDLSVNKTRSQKWAEQHLRHGHFVGVVPVLSVAHLNDGRDGPEAAPADLFHNSIFCLMPSVSADPHAVETAVNFGRLLGATPYFLDPAEYDGLAGGIETLPGLAAAALFSAVQKSTGWRDMLRFANTTFALATQPLLYGTDITGLALNDKAATLRWLDAYLQELTDLRRLIHSGDREMIDLTLGNLLIQRERWLRERGENEWAEGIDVQIDRPTVSDQFLGGWLGGKLKKGKGDE
ncbi:putative Prephenate dehydrogenase [Candidatus Promineifilum breve]|uniref:Prephenate dehydrogenase n=1 Tax=Candidatus Promineifilum breve TaxID=1806508 RepID=A0A160T547_9CHLR|nr:prephenate dehydrogenase/arogenate dehydrogenase family protein [Candidatus Promineifilum breve]CUS05306.2 putative Prephenate dehydrogenase [Candidatus Promineifilum breve]